MEWVVDRYIGCSLIDVAMSTHQSAPREERRLVLESLSERVAEVPEPLRRPHVTPRPSDEIHSDPPAKNVT